MNKTRVKNLGLFVASFVLTLVALVAGSKLWINVFGIRDSQFRYENQLDMWDSEPAIGFVNKPNFSSFCFGNVRVQTNERGFRGARPTLGVRTNGICRIVGMGDSVMWGTGVNEEESILGLLERRLNNESPYEVINAGVVGYSTYQEFLYLKKYVLPLKPDVVVVNYCANDFLPTEDPFKNVRGIYVQYLEQLRESRDQGLTAKEKKDLKDLIHIFNSADRVWVALRELENQSPSWLDLTTKVFVEVPVAWMAQLSREAGIRLIYVFIPPKRGRANYAHIADQLKKILIEQGAEFVDVQSGLEPDPDELTRTNRMSPSKLAWLWPEELKHILISWSLQTAHRRDKYIDSEHPTKRGNAIIAEHIYRYLTKTSRAKEREFPDSAYQ